LYESAELKVKIPSSAAVLCVSLGLRISEGLALKWSDVDWLNGVLLVERGIATGRVDETGFRDSSTSRAKMSRAKKRSQKIRLQS